MFECDLRGVEAQGWSVEAEGLHVAYFTAGQIGGIADYGPDEMGGVDANLIGATGARTGFEQRGAVGKVT